MPLADDLGRFGIRTAEFLKRHHKLVIGSALVGGLYMGHPFKGVGSAVQDMTFGDPNAIRRIGVDTFNYQMNRSFMPPDYRRYVDRAFNSYTMGNSGYSYFPLAGGPGVGNRGYGWISSMVNNDLGGTLPLQGINGRYGTAAIGGSESTDNWLSAEAQYRNLDSTKSGPSGSLVFGLYNSRMNY